MCAEARRLAYVCLLVDPVEAEELAARLMRATRPSAGARDVVLVPPVRGRDFFAATALQADLDAWWRQEVPAHAVPVYLIAHEEGLAEWLGGLDGVFLVVADHRSRDAYRSWIVVEPTASGRAAALAAAAIRRFGGGVATAGVAADIFGLPSARLTPSAPADPPPQPWGRPHLPPLFGSAGTTSAPGAATEPLLDPLDLLVAESVRTELAGPLWPASPWPDPAGSHARRSLRARPRLPRLPVLRRGPVTSDAVLAADLLERSPTLVVVGSRKGGVGKTSHAAGVAIVAGMVLDGVGHRAAIVDANVANPDAWGHLDLPAQAATVRDVVAALTAGTEPPPPVHAVTPALACYPERREGVEYSRTDIRRLASYLRSRYAFTVVDMSNRLPDPTSGPEAAAAAFWLEEADALVLPTATSRQDFNGVLDYLDVPGLPPTVVPCIVSAARRNRRHAVARHYLSVIAARVECVVDIPDEADSVRLAGLAGLPVHEVSRRMGAAYRDLTCAVVRLPTRARR